MAVDLSQLLALLNNAKGKYQSTDPQLYQVIKTLIQNLQALQNNKGNSDLVQAIVDIQKVISALELQGFLTWEDDSATLKNSRELLAGTNITFDDSIANQRTISASGGGGSSTSAGAIFIPRKERRFRLPIIPPPQQLKRVMNFVITAGGSIPTTGLQNYVNIPPVGGVFTKWRIVGFPSGSAVVDIKKGTIGSGSSICGSDKPTLSSAQYADSTALTGWTTGFDAGDKLQPSLDSVTTCTAVIVFAEYVPR